MAVEHNALTNAFGESGVAAGYSFAEQHYAIAYWARIWGFSPKTVREWFRDETGPGILRQPNTGRRFKRDYTTLMISETAAARIYAKRTGPTAITGRLQREVS